MLNPIITIFIISFFSDCSTSTDEDASQAVEPPAEVELPTPVGMEEIEEIEEMRDDYLNGLKDGWMDGWMDGQMDGWTGGWVDGRMDGWADGWTDGWVDAVSTVNANTIANTAYTNIDTAPNFNWSMAEYLGNLPPMTEEEFNQAVSDEFLN